MPENCDITLTNIGSLLTLAGSGPLLGKALGDYSATKGPVAIAVSDDRIIAVGEEAEIKANYQPAVTLDLHGALVTPGLIDCHTHPVFANSRVDEFEVKLAGESYESIMAKGGGIISSLKSLRTASDEELSASLKTHLSWMKKHGVVAAECKSGYGLSLEHERRSLEVIRDAQGFEGMHLEPTCLAAHSTPPEFKGRKDEYLDLVCNEILPSVANDKLASAVDIFIEENVFSGDDGRRVLDKAKELGLGAHVHADQLSAGEGTRIANECGALSADHLEYIDDKTIEDMARLGTTAVLLPGSTFFLRQDKWAPARKLIDAGVPVALATDFNPGSSPTANPAFVMTLGCLKLGMTAHETLAAFTRNAAHALRIDKDYGSIEVGKRAAFTVWAVNDLREIPYWFGTNLVKETIIL